MSTTLKNEAKAVITNAFLESGNIRSAARVSGRSRNTVRKVLKEEGLIPPVIPSPPKATTAKVQRLELKHLDELLMKCDPTKENKDFADHLKKTVAIIAKEIGVNSAADKLRLEAAIYHFISFRKYYFMSLQTGSQSYVGPYSKAHDKQAKATLAWVDASLKSFDAFNRVIRELEVKNGLRPPNYGKGNTFVGQQQVNIGR